MIIQFSTHILVIVFRVYFEFSELKIVMPQVVGNAAESTAV